MRAVHALSNIIPASEQRKAFEADTLAELTAPDGIPIMCFDDRRIVGCVALIPTEEGGPYDLARLIDPAHTNKLATILEKAVSEIGPSTPIDVVFPTRDEEGRLLDLGFKKVDEGILRLIPSQSHQWKNEGGVWKVQPSVRGSGQASVRRAVPSPILTRGVSYFGGKDRVVVDSHVSWGKYSSSRRSELDQD
ncbi:hypothetical protein GWC77_24795 [Paraburkholderia sp. NMBU_R16]|uniref:hypothetical protein n=1 Tax=Paraburkholderia sp. NMBU_R16 TaxID=2698676 RepID=UPI0015659792|nr:hypothetical protein [Paraburkholderia sp. NMBU_R16]NRO99121.1 hypothetical protein [Paraburkholderia sp. NMBU_R16]